MAGSDTDRNVILSDLQHEAHKIAEAVGQPKFWWDGGEVYINVEYIRRIYQDPGLGAWNVDVDDEYVILTEAQKKSLVKFLRETGRL